MSASQRLHTRLVPLLALLVGAILVATGLLAIGAYVRGGFTDLSLLYWALFLPFVGIGMVGAGTCLLVIARKAWRGEPSALALARHSLLGLGIASATLVAAGHFRQQQIEAETRVLDQRFGLRGDRERNTRKLDRLDIAVAGHQSIIIRAQPSAGLDGRYRWTLKVFNDQAVLYESSRELSLRGAVPAIVRRMDFAELFAKCFDPVPSDAYACVRNAGARELYIVQARLELIDDGRERPTSAERRYNPIQATASAELELDTRTTDQAVIVMGVKHGSP